MARFILSLQLLLCLLTREAFATTVIDSTGAVNRGASPLQATSKGVVAIISSPGDLSNSFSPLSSEDVSADVDSSSGCIVVSSPGATLGGSDKGSASAAASSVAGSIVLTGVTPSDCDGIVDTRHGKTLYSIFASRLNQIDQDSASGDKTLLIVAVEGTTDDTEKVVSDITSIFDTCALAVTGADTMEIDDLYEIEVLSVNSADDAATVMSTAAAAGIRSPLAQTSGNVVSAITEVYTKSASLAGDVPTSSEIILICEDSFTRHARAVRAKLAAWKNRVDRYLLVEKFGAQATTLLKRTMDAYDKDTISAAGSESGAASCRLELRSKLKGRMENGIRELFEAQVDSAEKSTLKKFNAMLLRQKGKPTDGEKYQDNAASVRAAAFAFDTALSDLEVPSLSLKKAKYSQDMNGKLNNALSTFPDSVAAQLKDLKTVKKMASRQKKPTQRSMDIGLGLVAMIRPDGFGTLQGFAGYTMGSNSVTVGVHNDADAPETISQFGGSRPPFVRIQPKLNLDIEL